MTVNTIVVGLFVGVVALALSKYAWDQRKRAQQRRFIENYTFPHALRMKLQSRHPYLGPEAIDEVFSALRAWFLLLQKHPKEKFGMPSRVVDDAWHEFILMTRLYQRFCEEGFGGYVHHEPNQPNEPNAKQEDAALGRTLARSGGMAALGVAGGVAVGGAALFAIDAKLGVENGFSYTPQTLDLLERSYRDSLASSGGGGGCSGYSGSDSSDGGGSDGGGGGCGGGGCGS